MDINQLNCFISVAQTLNFSEAARRNFVSQSTVSRYISDLEKEFGVQLFTRSHRDVVMTNEGKTLLPYALEIVATLDKAKKIISRMQNGGTGKLTIGCDVTSMDFPSRCIADFTSKYKGISVDLKRLDAADRSLAVTGGDYDFCFMPRDMVPESSGIETLVTHIEPLVVLASANGDFRRRKSLSLAALADKKLVLLSESAAPILYMEIMDMLRTFHITPTVDGVFDELMEVYVAVLSGMGVSVVPQSLADLVAGDKAISIPISDADTGISYVMAWSKTISNPIAKLFIETVKKYAAGDDGGYGL